MEKIKKRFIYLIALFSFLPFFVFSAGLCEDCRSEACDSGLSCVAGLCQEPTRIRACPASRITDLLGVAKMAARAVFYVWLFAMPLFIFWYIFSLMSAGDSPRRIQTAKNLLFYYFIGLLIVGASWGLLDWLTGYV